MKTILNFLFWLFIATLTSLTLIACEKQEPAPEKTWYLDFAALNHRYGNLPACFIMDNIGNDNNVIGLCLDFKGESFLCRLFTFGADSVYQITGMIDGKPFIVIDNKMNICGGQQGLIINYKIEYR